MDQKNRISADVIKVGAPEPAGRGRGRGRGRRTQQVLQIIAPVPLPVPASRTTEFPSPRDSHQLVPLFGLGQRLPAGGGEEAEPAGSPEVSPMQKDENQRFRSVPRVCELQDEVLRWLCADAGNPAA